MSYHIGLQVLRAKIRGFHAAGSTISARIKKAEKEKKSRLWEAKRCLGIHSRYHLVAYGILRGIPYEQIEKCALNNQLDPKRLLEIIQAHNGWSKEKGLVQYDLQSLTHLLIVSSRSVSVCTADVKTITTIHENLTLNELFRAASNQLTKPLKRLLEKRSGS